MTTEIVAATKEINAVILAAWNAGRLSQNIPDNVSKLFWQGTAKAGVEEVGTAAQYWARAGMIDVTEGQSTLRGEESQRHTAVGLVMVQMFFPMSENNSWWKGLAVAKAIKNSLAVRTPSGTVWFRRPSIKRLAADSSHHRLNVVAEYEYDELIS